MKTTNKFAMNNNHSNALQNLRRKTRKTFREAAKSLPADVIQALKDRAAQGVLSNEPHKATGGWVAQPFYGKGYSILGLLEVASSAIKEAQGLS